MKKLLQFLCCVAAFSSCAKSGNDYQEQDRDVSFSYQISDASTKVNGSIFEDGDQIEVFAKSGMDTYAENVVYSYNAGVFTSATPIQYGSAASSLNFYATYPQGTQWSGIFDIAEDQSIADSYEVSDLLVANVESSESCPKLLFDHKLSAMEIYTKIEGDFTINVASQTSVEYDLVADTYVGTGEVSYLNVKSVSDTKHAVIIAPQHIAEGSILLTVTIDGKEYKLKTDSDIDIESGSMYKCKVEFDGETITFDGEVSSWGDGGDLDGDLDGNGGNQGGGDDFEPNTNSNISQLSNCYMLNPDEYTEFYIPIDERINDFWRNYSNKSDYYNYMVKTSTPIYADILWHDADESIEGVSIDIVTEGFARNSSVTPSSAPDFTTADCDIAMKVTLPSSLKEGNIIVAVKNQNSDAVLWSWHLWVTNYDPNVVGKVVEGSNDLIYNVVNGDVHRYEDVALGLWNAGGMYDGRYIMDRNLGERTNVVDNIADAGTLYYQFGRKDPFPGNDAKKGNGNASYTMNDEYKTVGLAEAVNNPTMFYRGGYNWTNEDANPEYVWNDKTLNVDAIASLQKSIFDPSPLGWRVPVNYTWNDLFDRWVDTTYQDLIEFPLLGCRNLEDGNISNVGLYGRLWSSTPNTYSLSYELHYSATFVYPNNVLGRTNANPVRCIQE